MCWSVDEKKPILIHPSFHNQFLFSLGFLPEFTYKIKRAEMRFAEDHQNNNPQ